MITLPHTGLQLPHNRLNCENFTPVLAEDDDVDFALTLTLDGDPAGTITNHDTGGTITYQPYTNSLFNLHELTHLAAASRTQAGRTPDVETVLKLLTEEHVIDQLLAEAQRDGATLVRHTHPDPDDGDSGDGKPREIYNCDVFQIDPNIRYRTRAECEDLARLLNRDTTCTNPTWQIWRGHTWTPLIAAN